MSELTRWSPLLVHIMKPELKEEFFGEDEQDTDAGWDLFETLYPEEAKTLFEVLSPMLEGIKEEMRHRRDVNAAREAGDERKATMLEIIHRANKLDW